MAQEFSVSYNHKYKLKRNLHERISLIKIPYIIHRASINDEELEDDIKWCYHIINTCKENYFTERDVEYAKNSLEIFNTEMQSRWWNKLEVSEILSNKDIKYIKYIVYRRYINTCEYQLEYSSKLRTSDMFKALDIVLNLYKEVKNL